MSGKVIFLGTSAGVPTKNRNVSAIALIPQNSKEWLLFDCGEATQHQLLYTHLSTHSLNKIFITHLHGDHIYGLFGLLASKAMSGVETSLSIYGPDGIEEIVNTIKRLSNLTLPFSIRYITLTGSEVLKFDNYDIETVELKHSVSTIGYIYSPHTKPKLNMDMVRALNIPIGPILQEIKKKDKIVLNGQTIDTSLLLTPPDIPKRVIIAGDNQEPQRFTAHTPIDTMIHEATYIESDYNNLKIKFMHTTAKDLAITAQKMGVKRLVMTHISPRYTKDREYQLIKETKEYFEGKVILAQDFMEIDI